MGPTSASVIGAFTNSGQTPRRNGSALDRGSDHLCAARAESSVWFKTGWNSRPSQKLPNLPEYPRKRGYWGGVPRCLRRCRSLARRLGNQTASRTWSLIRAIRRLASIPSQTPKPPRAEALTRRGQDGESGPGHWSKWSKPQGRDFDHSQSGHDGGREPCERALSRSDGRERACLQTEFGPRREGPVEARILADGVWSSARGAGGNATGDFDQSAWSLVKAVRTVERRTVGSRRSLGSPLAKGRSRTLSAAPGPQPNELDIGNREHFRMELVQDADAGHRTPGRVRLNRAPGTTRNSVSGSAGDVVELPRASRTRRDGRGGQHHGHEPGPPYCCGIDLHELVPAVGSPDFLPVSVPGQIRRDTVSVREGPLAKSAGRDEVRAPPSDLT
jgi:hypothetical protein